MAPIIVRVPSRGRELLALGQWVLRKESFPSSVGYQLHTLTCSLSEIVAGLRAVAP